jgi:hypothetical protein
MANRDKPAVVALSTPCANCPFRRDVGAIALAPGRLAQIARDMVADDHAPFLCHKAAYAPKAEAGTIAECRGAQIYLRKAGSPNLPMRMAFALGLLTPAELDAQAGMVVDPQDLHGDA